MGLGDKQDVSRLKFPASRKSLKKEPAWRPEWSSSVGRESVRGETEKVNGGKGKSHRAL